MKGAYVSSCTFCVNGRFGDYLYDQSFPHLVDLGKIRVGFSFIPSMGKVMGSKEGRSIILAPPWRPCE